MGGVSTGPKSFSFGLHGTANGAWNPKGATDYAGWQIENTHQMIWQEQRLDLRAYLQDGRGLNLMNIAVQESGPWAAIPGTDEGDKQLPVYWICVDILSSVRLNLDTIKTMNAYNDPGLKYNYYPGFNIPSGSLGMEDDQIQLNSSQVIWGLWRAFASDANVLVAQNTLSPPFTNLQLGQRVWSSGEFGSGEVLVAPQCYLYRVVYTGQELNLNIPAANIEMIGETLDLKPYVELNQMARLAQR